MKKYLIGLLVLATFFAGCSSSSVGANMPSSFEILSRDSVHNSEVEKIRDKETGCYYLSSSGSYKAALTQMFIEKDGVSVPYCDDLK
ncbi:hypothetical protein [Sporosarcina sp. FSL W7-1283]|uniref:hypothetical protein n=1 Tax=Sporosarcina sp. FSL W7-1283 TaxID=2921560 RepID=UPI0030F74C4E